MSPLLIVVSIVLVDLMGFSLVMPLLPPFAEEYGFSETRIGLLLAAFPLCQLFAGPILGRLSDRFGRRPILVISQMGTVLSFLILGLTENFWLMLFARALDGASGGNILVAQAYVADVTKPRDRSKGLGMIGAAFGVGFVLGPLLGGTLITLPIDTYWRLKLPFLVAAGFSMIAWILVVTKLPESRPAEGGRRVSARVVNWKGIAKVVGDRKVGLMVALGALVVLAFACLEGTFSLFLQRRMGWQTHQAAYGFAFLGLISAVVQGGLIRRLVPKFGEPRLILAGLTLLALGFVGLALTRSVAGLFGAMLAVGLGQGLSSPTVSGLLSRITSPSEQGAIFGTLISAQTLARMISYPIALRLLATGGPSAPYWEGAAIAGVALLLAVWVIWGILGGMDTVAEAEMLEAKA